MMKSMQLTSSKHSNTPHNTTALARRVVLLLSFLTFCLGSVWGQNYKIINMSFQDNVINANQYANASDDDRVVLSFFCNETLGNNYGFGRLCEPGWNESHGYDLYGDVQKNAYIYINCSFKEFKNSGSTDGVRFNIWARGVELRKAEIYVNPFKGELKNGIANESKDVIVANRSTAFVELDLSEIRTKLANTKQKYARFYLTDAKNNQIDPANRLTVKYKGNTANPCIIPPVGSYIYYDDDGDNLTTDMFKQWDGYGASASPTGAATGVGSRYGENLNSGDVVIGVISGSIPGSTYADLTGYTKMVFTGTPNLYLRVVMNRQGMEDSGNFTEKNGTIDNNGTAEIDLTGLDYVHLNTIKVGGSATGHVTSIKLIRADAPQSDEIDLSQLSIQLAAPKAYKLYKVVCAFSSDIITKEGAYFIREPDFDLQYTYNFIYPNPTTTEIKKETALRVNGMTLDTSPDDPDKDWDTSWDELSIGHYVKWYIEDSNGNLQTLETGTSHQQGKWVINLPSEFSAENQALVLNGQTSFTSEVWNNCKNLIIYAPAETSLETLGTLNGYKLICEIYTSNNITNTTPNIRYIFSLYKDFLGELNDASHNGTKIFKDFDFLNTSCTLNLSDALAGYNTITPSPGEVNYARIWLTKTDGTLVNPIGKLTISPEIPLYKDTETTDKSFGYYFIKGNGIDLSNLTMKLELEAGSFDQYQVHVAFSNGLLTDCEPNYDYVYTFGFRYPVKTKYKTIICRQDNNNWKLEPSLLYNWTELAVDCNVGKTILNNKLYLRWYLIDNNGNKVQMSSFSTPGNDSWNDYSSDGDLGYYHWGNTNLNMGNDRPYNDWDGFQPTITFTKNGNNYQNVRLVCEATISENDPGNIASDIRVKYIYTLKTENDLSAQRFVHYPGEAYRYLKEIGDDEQIGDYNYEDVTEKYGNYDGQNYTWNVDDLSVNDYNTTTTNRNIRQKVHTVDYYYYVDKNGGDVELILPLQYYVDGGQNTEARAYYRWYNYKTDKNEYLTPFGNELNKTTGWWGQTEYNIDTSRGLFAIKIGNEACNEKIGVRFNQQGRNALNDNDEILIACDVSRYLDGMDESYTYLIHEPTLTVRYIFHILPKTKIDKDISEVGNDLTAVENIITSGNKPTKILEYEGRTVVSTNNGQGEFSLRTRLNDLRLYLGTMHNSNSKPRIWWYAYYQDKNGNWWKHQVKDPDTNYLDLRYNPNKGKYLKRSEMYQAKYSLNDLVSSDGYPWSPMNGQSTSNAPTEIKVGDRVQMVACIGTGTAPTTNDKPIIWTEIDFVDAKPLLLGTETEERIEENLKRDYVLADSLEFNNFPLMGQRKPQNSYDNYGKIPLLFKDAQYGFSYPQLYGLCYTNLTCNWAGYGISPMHGDYLLLKSMNMPGISVDTDWYNQSIFCNWWEDEKENGNQIKQQLYDVTHERDYQKGITNGDDYGGFLYVDAADEARTIAKMEFKATLCHDAKIYYSAYIASMTGYSDNQPNGQTPPMLRFRVTTWDDAQQKYIPVVTFVTGDIKQEVNYDGDGLFKQAHWYQVYGYTTIPSELEELLKDQKERSYYVEIDNYCDNTDGADYCVDQITFYTSNAKLRVKQAGKNCGDGSAIPLNVYMSADDLKQYQDGNTIIYWRICDGNGNPLTDIDYGNEGKLYGQVLVTTMPEEDEDILQEADLEFHTTGKYFRRNKDKFFSLTKELFVLAENTTYFISVYPLDANSLNENLSWGNPNDKCTVYSPLFVPKPMYLDVEDGKGRGVKSVDLGCPNHDAQIDLNMVVYIPDDSEKTGYHKYTDVHYDYFKGTLTEFYAYTLKDDANVRLDDAIFDFRQKWIDLTFEQRDYNSAYEVNNLPTAYYTTSADGEKEKKEKYYAVIKQAMEEGLLYLSSSPNVKLAVDEEHPTILALPIEDKVEYNGNNFEVCSPLAFTFEVNNDLIDPIMTLGFDDVEIPASYTKQVVRVGLKQLEKMKSKEGENYKLHIPIQSYGTKKGNTTNALYFSTESKGTEQVAYLKLSAINENSDPTLTTDNIGLNFAKIEAPDASDRPYVDNNHMYLSLDLSECEFDFHEGYEYEVSTSFIDETGIGVTNPCIGDLFLIIKVVPEFVTWDAQIIKDHNEYYSTNWYDDNNWRRSNHKELYKTEDAYKDGQNITPAPATNPGYVPMKFTYVTLLTKNYAPSLISEPKKFGENYQGGSLIDPDQTEMTSTSSPFDEEIESLPTTDIRYDMMVRYGSHDDGGEGCFGHRHLDSSGNWVGNGSDGNATAKVFDVEKYYGNICKEIYFKPGAELLYQQHLTYEKAWVEKELVANKWYLMSTPLKATYAGDMYVPAIPIRDYSLTPSTDVTGRQVTEAFKDIEFTDNISDKNIYSRTTYPIYQRSWGTAHDSKVIVSKNDAFRSDYSAALKYTTWMGNIAEWGHTFNDVGVDYTAMTGFSIRAHKKDQKNGEDNVKALIRLPKKDVSYDYYQWNNTSPDEGKVTQTVGKDDYAKLIDMEKSASIPGEKPVYYKEVLLQDVQSQGKDADGYTYYLVGNPFMASLDMKKFFDVNTNLGQAFYTYEESNAEANGVYGKIRPLQAFFVKAENASGSIKFTDAMMMDGNYGAPTPASSPAHPMTMTASNGRGQSSATLSVGEEVRSVETLFDSNLEDVPMVYTVADGQAVSIQQLTELSQPVAFGVTCAASDDPVEVTFTDIDQLTGSDIYVVDAVTGSQTAIGEGDSYTVQPNDYGRYFLLAGTTAIDDKTDIAKGIMVSVRGREVTVTSGEELTQVHALTLNGTTHYEATAIGTTTTSFTLSSGVYIIKTENVIGEKMTVKIIVK